jgi:hypothetical protein
MRMPMHGAVGGTDMNGSAHQKNTQEIIAIRPPSGLGPRVRVIFCEICFNALSIDLQPLEARGKESARGVFHFIKTAQIALIVQPPQLKRSAVRVAHAAIIATVTALED